MAKDDIMIVIQNRFQRSMLRKFGPNGVCCDSRHRTNGHDFLLTVINGFEKGFPAACCISNHEDFTMMCNFFSKVKKNTGTISPQCYIAWVGGIDECPRLQRFLCMWHVDKASTNKLREKNW